MATEQRNTLLLRPLAESDRFRVRRWLAEPHVAQWFGSRSAAEAAMTLAAQSATALARIIEHDGTPIGYVHALDVSDPKLPPDIWSAEVFIGDPSWRGQGLGAVALQLLRDELFATTLATALAIRVPIRNEQAVRAIEKSGFTWQAVLDDALLGRCWLLIARRS